MVHGRYVRTGFPRSETYFWEHSDPENRASESLSDPGNRASESKRSVTKNDNLELTNTLRNVNGQTLSLSLNKLKKVS
jgi:hypothetical protein